MTSPDGRHRRLRASYFLAAAALLLLIPLWFRERQPPVAAKAVAAHAPGTAAPAEAVPAPPPQAPSAPEPVPAEGKPAPSLTWISGRVTCRETGQPIQGVRVQAEFNPGLTFNSFFEMMSWCSSASIKTHTDARGEYRIEVPLEADDDRRHCERYALLTDGSDNGYLPCSGEYSFWKTLELLKDREKTAGRARDPNLTKEDLDAVTYPMLSPGEERRHDIALSRGVGFVVTAVRTDNGQPAGLCDAGYNLHRPDMEALCFHTTTAGTSFTDRLEVGGIDPDLIDWDRSTLVIFKGNQRVDVVLKDYPLVDARKLIVVRFDPGQTLRGRVLGPDGLPYTNPNCRILCWPAGQERDDHRDARASQTMDGSIPDGSGAFVLDFLPKDPSSFLLEAIGMEDAIQPGPVTGTPDREVIIRLETGGQISGRVLDKHGRPVTGAQVWAEEKFRRNRWGGRYSRQRSASADAEGRYVLSHLPDEPGLEISTFFDGLDIGWKDVPVGTINLDIILGDGGGIQQYPR